MTSPMDIAPPAFPVDDATLDMLMAAMYPRQHGDPDAESSTVWPLLEMISHMAAGPDIAVGEPIPIYHEHSVLHALIVEVRRLRTLLGENA